MNQSFDLQSIRNCMEGVVPSTFGTVSADGTPNITYVSQVFYVDKHHVALTYQFFNKTRENILANPYGMLQVVDPDTSAHFRLSVKYLRTETDGPLYETMKAGLDGIASHTGMAKVFRLLGADIYKVLSIEGLNRARLPCALPQRSRLAALRAAIKQLEQPADLELLFGQLLQALHRHFEFSHGMLLMHNENGRRLYIVDSFGYDVSGVGAEIPWGIGVIGVAAQAQTPIRILYTAGKYSYNVTVRNNLLKENPRLQLETEIPFAGLSDPQSQIAIPVMARNQLLGVIYLDSEQSLRFTYEDEDALVVLADAFAQRLVQIQELSEVPADPTPALPTRNVSGEAVTIRHFKENDSIFINDQYLIKGVAGAILWKLLISYVNQNRVEFSNRELRLDPTLGLPDIGDNLETRLVLLHKRLLERCDFLRIVKCGRGRFTLQIDREVVLSEA